MKLKRSQIKSNPNNPRLIKDDNFKKLVKSIQEFPEMLEAREIVVNKDHIILGGNMRFKAAKEAGLKEVPVKIVDWSEDKQRQFVIKDNVSGGEWDWDILANEWDAEQLDAWGLDTPDGWGEETEVEEDEAPEVDESEPPKSKLGEIYQLGRHKVMCGDSTDSTQAELLMSGEPARLLFTSPPYADMREYNGGKELSTQKLAKFISAFEPFVELQAVNLGIAKKEGNINEYWQEYIDVAKSVGYKLDGWNIWQKSTVSVAQETHYIFPCYHEFVFIFAKEKVQLKPTVEKKNKGFVEGSTTRRMADGSTKVTSRGVSQSATHKKMSSVLSTNSELGSIRKEHPATYPVELPAEYIKATSNPEEAIIDPFLGSGSTLVACEQTDRTCYGMELDPKYVDVIRKRYHKFVTGSDEGWEDGTPAI